MGKKTGTRSSDSTRRSLTGKGVGERGMALTGAGGSGALAQVVAVRAGAGGQIAQREWHLSGKLQLWILGW